MRTVLVTVGTSLLTNAERELGSKADELTDDQIERTTCEPPNLKRLLPKQIPFQSCFKKVTASFFCTLTRKRANGVLNC